MSESKEPPLILKLLLLAMIISLVVVLPLAALRDGYLSGGKEGFFQGQSAEQQKAIEAGVARWTIDEKTGLKEFHYGAVKN